MDTKASTSPNSRSTNGAISPPTGSPRSPTKIEQTYHLKVTADAFPQDLYDAQTELHRIRAAYEALCRGLPWSVDPASGWSGEKALHSEYRRDVPDSPGYTPEQTAQESCTGPVCWSCPSWCRSIRTGQRSNAAPWWTHVWS